MKTKMKNKGKTRNQVTMTGISKQDLMLKQIYFYKNISPEAYNVLVESSYAHKMKEKLLSRGLIKKSSLKSLKKATKKAGITARLHNYHITSKGERYLAEKFPDEIFISETAAHSLSNDIIGRRVKVTDSMIMSEIAGAFVVKDDAVAKEKIVKDNLAHGVYISAKEARRNLILTKDDVSQYKFSALTGVLLTKTTPYCLYHAENGLLTLSARGEEKIASHLISSFAKNYGLYPEELIRVQIPNAIIFCKAKTAFARLALNWYQQKSAPGDTFSYAYVIPVSRDGCNIIKRFAIAPDYKARFLDMLVSVYGYDKNKGYARGCFPIINQVGEPVYVGIDFEINSLRTAVDVISTEDSQYSKMVIVCYAWQQDYYNEVIRLLDSHKIICQPIDEKALDENLGYKGRISTTQKKYRYELISKNI